MGPGHSTHTHSAPLGFQDDLSDGRRRLGLAVFVVCMMVRLGQWWFDIIAEWDSAVNTRLACGAVGQAGVCACVCVRVCVLRPPAAALAGAHCG